MISSVAGANVLLAPWASLFSSTASVSATLIGFAAVALSVNLTPILASPWLVTRAAQVLVRLAAVLVLSLMLLVPDAFAAIRPPFVLLSMLLFWLWASLLDIRARPPVKHASMAPVAALAGMLGTLLLALSDAWVLLVEILR